MRSGSELEGMVAAMSREEKVSLLSGSDFWRTRALPRLGVRRIMVADGPHGLRKQSGDADHLGITASVPATCFPPAVTTASSWDRSLLRSIGQALGAEARSESVSVLLGPGVNIKRSPLCGRNFEYFSEDPFLAGELAAAFIEGVQGEGVGASLKHFAANNQEAHRLVVDAIVDERSLREIYLPAFEKAVTRAKPWTVMCSYNKLNGVHASDDPWLLRKVLREDWGFEGVVVTDWGAMYDRIASVKAGLELEMPGNGGQNDAAVLAALADGRLDEALVDEAVLRLLELVDRAAAAGTVAGEGPDAASAAAPAAKPRFDLEAHHALAREAAERSMVLLKNEGAVLPLARSARVAVIGDFAKTPRYQGSGSSQIVPTRLDAAYEELCALAGRELPYARGFDLRAEAPDAALEAAARAAAAEAETILVFLGLPPVKESEGFDREDLSLPRNQVSLLEALAAARRLAQRLVVVLSNGAPVEMPWLDKVDALLEGYLGGQGGGAAIARLLYGEANPSGKLAETFPLRLEDNPSHPYFPGSVAQVQYREGLYVGYRFYDSAGAEPLFPFGFGLSYTGFSYGKLELSAAEIGEDEGLVASCEVTNVGRLRGAEIVQLYVRDPESTVHRPWQELKGFEKLELEPGETGRAVFRLDRRRFAFWDADACGWRVEGGDFLVRIGASSRDIRLEGRVCVKSGSAPRLDPARRAALAPYYLEPAAAGAANPGGGAGALASVGDEAFAALLGRPIPIPAPRRPFGLDSTMGEIGQSPV
ncbi:MAG: glycoside hydrolase family 3 C-terminal domain-containing protein, partial [Spirochaetaceae bacterium]|nr:glycoside hydrolase family 3 C-terminal domain-containing protein [Spirochaetaceae bacterium]